MKSKKMFLGSLAFGMLAAASARADRSVYLIDIPVTPEIYDILKSKNLVPTKTAGLADYTMKKQIDLTDRQVGNKIPSLRRSWNKRCPTQETFALSISLWPTGEGTRMQSRPFAYSKENVAYCDSPEYIFRSTTIGYEEALLQTLKALPVIQNEPTGENKP